MDGRYSFGDLVWWTENVFILVSHFLDSLGKVFFRLEVLFPENFEASAPLAVAFSIAFEKPNAVLISAFLFENSW